VAPIRKKYDVLHMQSHFARVLSNDFCPVLPRVMHDQSIKRSLELMQPLMFLCMLLLLCSNIWTYVTLQ